jgi:hypothetical protein
MGGCVVLSRSMRPHAVRDAGHRTFSDQTGNSAAATMAGASLSARQSIEDINVAARCVLEGGHRDAVGDCRLVRLRD